jgi:ribose transport system substrate-binding protein
MSDLGEFYRALRQGKMSRREFLKAAGAIVGSTAASSLLAACAATPAPTEAPPEEAPTEAPPEEATTEAPPEEAPTEAPPEEAPTEAPVEGEWVRPEDRPVRWVDCTRYYKEPPWKYAFASQGPTNAWALGLDGHSEYAVTDKFAPLFSDYFYAGADGKADKQVSDIESLLIQKPDVLFVCGLGEAVKTVCDKAYDDGIPVIHMQMPFQSEKYTMYLNADNYDIGAHFAEWLAEELGGKGKILMASGIAGVDTAERRLQAANDVFANYPDIEVLAHGYMNWSQTDAKKGFEAWLPAFPEIDGIWSDSASHTGPAIEAFVEAGREIPPLTGEPQNQFLKIAKEHDVRFKAIGYPNSMSMEAVGWAVSILMGERVPFFYKVTPFEFTHEEIDDYVRMDLPDDPYLDYRFPAEWMEKLFPS